MRESFGSIAPLKQKPSQCILAPENTNDLRRERDKERRVERIEEQSGGGKRFQREGENEEGPIDAKDKVEEGNDAREKERRRKDQ